MLSIIFFFFNHTSTTEIYTLSLHDALPISSGVGAYTVCVRNGAMGSLQRLEGRARKEEDAEAIGKAARSEEHTSELQSHSDLVCRLLLEKKKKKKKKE